MRLAVLSTHPIQYNAPLFRELASREGIDLRVFYSWEGTASSNDPDFGLPITWDVPLLDGYAWELVENKARDPGTHHYGGLDNPSMNTRLADWRPDALMVYGWAWRTHLSAMRFFKGRVPILFRGDSTLLTVSETRWKRVLRRPALAWVYRHIDVALSPGQHNFAYLRQMGVPERRIRHMPHAIDIERFSPENSEYLAAADRLRNAFDIQDEDTTFVFAGKLIKRKAVDVLIKAFRRTVETTKSRARLLIAGDGPERLHLEKMAADLSQVSFLGFRNQTEMPAVYLAGDVFVLPSLIETWGLAVNEALALGRPVIASDRVGAAPDLLADKTYGRVFHADNVDALTCAMRDLMIAGKSPSIRAAARTASVAWSIPRAADSILSVLDEFVGHADNASLPEVAG